MAASLAPEHRRELESLLAQLKESQAIIEHLLAGPEVADARVVNLHRTEAIVWTLDHDRVPMSPTQIRRRMRELGRMNDPAMEVQTTTYDLWRQGRIAKISRGMYCSNDHVPPGVSRMMPEPPDRS